MKEWSPPKRCVSILEKSKLVVILSVAAHSNALDTVRRVKNFVPRSIPIAGVFYTCCYGGLKRDAGYGDIEGYWRGSMVTARQAV